MANSAFLKSTGAYAPRALVTGGTGAVGTVLVRRLIDQGYQVRVLARHLPSTGHMPEYVQTYQGDITDANVLRVATANVDIVFHLVAKLHINNPPVELHAEYQRVNVEGTRCVVKAALAAGVSRLILFSTVSVYGPSQAGEVLDEGSPPQPQSSYARSKLQAETIALDAQRGDTNEPLATILRLAAVYGPRVKGNYARLITAIRRGWFVPIGSGRNRRTLIYDQDVASAALLAAKQPLAAGQVYNVTDGQPHTFHEILTAIYEACGKQPPKYHIPVSPIYFLADTLERCFRLAGRDSPIGHATVDKLLEDVAVNGEKFQRELGFRPQFDLFTGWRETIRQMEQ